MIKVIKIIAIDILLVLSTMILYQFTSFLLGYSSNENHNQEAKFLLGAFILSNLIVNFFVNRNLYLGRIILIVSSIFILVVYTVLLIISPL
jgi:hypothetical protein